MEKGLLIVGHGSRSLDAQKTFSEMVEIVRKKVSYETVEGAHMEISDPNIPTMIEKMVREGIKEILIVPYFLYPGIHIKKDIPEIIESLTEKYSDVIFKMGEPIGTEPLLADIIAKKAKEIE